jgi:hypothetical protein
MSTCRAQRLRWVAARQGIDRGRSSVEVVMSRGAARVVAGTPGNFRGQWARTGSAAGSSCGVPGRMSSPQMIAPAAKIAADHQNAVV